MAEQGAKYQKVIDWVKKNIADGTFQAGDRLMSEQELSRHFGLSRQTIRHATGELVNQRILTRVKGSGTYIGDPQDAQGRNRTGSSAAGEAEDTENGVHSGEREGQKESRGKKDSASKGTHVLREATMNIAVVSTFYESYIFPDTLKGIERILTKNGYSMQVTFTDNRLYREEAILKTILEKDNVDGLIVEPAKSALPDPNIPLYREIQKRGIPILFFNASFRELDAPCVRIDDTGIADKATQVLIDAGHRKIAGIFKADDRQGPLRYQGYLAAMIRAGYRAEQKSVFWLDTPETVTLSDIGDYLFRRIEGCTGVVCYNDQVAYQFIELALARGIDVPKQLSVVGIDDSYLARVGRVPFTSFPHPKEILGRKVAENLLEMIRDPDFDGNYLFDSEPVFRESVASV